MAKKPRQFIFQIIILHKYFTNIICKFAIQNHFETMKSVSMKNMFQEDSSRASKFHIQWNDFLIDYSKNRINQETMDLLVNLANEVHLKEAIAAYFDGEAINKTEN